MQRERVQVGRKPIGRLKGLRQCAGQYRRKSNGNRLAPICPGTRAD